VPPAEAVRPETNRTKPAPTPPPQIGSGGNDLFLFTQTRAALNADAELKGVNPVIEIKGGVVTLTGKVATAAQKSRAEQVARGVAGVKSVNNQLQVSAGK
jgi:osmotically-inducible protein OsmY